MQMQDQWAHCTKCHTLNYAAQPGLCALGGTHRNSGHNYVLALDTTRPDTLAPTGANAMVGWRWCSRCQALHYPAWYNTCPVPVPQNNVPKNPNVPKTLTYVDPPAGYVYGSKPHGPDGAYYSVLPLWGREIAYDTNAGVEEGWKWCRRCSQLFHRDAGSALLCSGVPDYFNPEAAPHDGSGSTTFGVMFANLPRARTLTLTNSGKTWLRLKLRYSPLWPTNDTRKELFSRDEFQAGQTGTHTIELSPYYAADSWVLGANPYPQLRTGAQLTLPPYAVCRPAACFRSGEPDHDGDAFIFDPASSETVNYLAAPYALTRVSFS